MVKQGHTSASELERHGILSGFFELKICGLRTESAQAKIKSEGVSGTRGRWGSPNTPKDAAEFQALSTTTCPLIS